MKYLYTCISLNSNILLKRERKKERERKEKLLNIKNINNTIDKSFFESLNIRKGLLNYPELKYHRSFIILRHGNVARNEVNVRA